MNAKPLKGWILLMKVKTDFTVTGSAQAPVIVPVGDKSSTFFNRSKVVAISFFDRGSCGIVVGDIVVTSNLAGQLSVPGLLKNEDDVRREVIFTPIDQIVGVLEGDAAELDEAPRLNPIITSRNGGKE